MLAPQTLLDRPISESKPGSPDISPNAWRDALHRLTPVVIDFETYWAKDYTLKANKLCNFNTAQYVRDPRFIPHGAGIKVGDDDPVWVSRRGLSAI
jgi:hypothetical protein